MRKKFNVYSFWFITITLIYFLSLLSMSGSMLGNTDNIYLINRAEQMLSCIKDGNTPFFYYNDLGGVGYGSSFFYGHLTLYPFLPLLLIGKLSFLYTYVSVSYLLIALGVSQLSKRFVRDYSFITMMFMSSTFVFLMFNYIKMYANMLGVGLGFLFLAFIIDFFRDKKSFIPAGLLFFLLINTHLLTSVICFVLTIVIMIYYFDKSRLKDYVKFSLFTCMVCSYFVANFLYHIDQLNNLADINKFVINSFYVQNVYGISIIPFEYLLQNLILNNINSLLLVDLLVLVVFSLTLAKSRKSISLRLKILLIIGFVLTILGVRPIWVWFNKNVIITPFQFPFRYMIFILFFMMLIVFSRVKSRDLKLFLCFYSIIYTCICSLTLNFQITEEYSNLDKYTGNGEYVSERFVCDTDEFAKLSSQVLDSNGREYDYQINGNSLVFDVTSDANIAISIPKLYYSGYVAYLDDRELEISEGYSQFVELKIPECSQGTVSVYYRHPIFLKILDLCCLLVVLVSFISDLRRRYRLGITYKIS